MNHRWPLLLLIATLTAGCGAAGASTAAAGSSGSSSSSGSGGSTSAPANEAPAADARLAVKSGFYVEAIAQVSGARELALDGAGNLIVGTTGKTVAIVPNADGAGTAGTPATLVTLTEGPAEGVALGNGSLYVGTNTAVWQATYANGSAGTPAKIVAVRTGPVAPNSDGDVHSSTSVAVTPTALYISVGSSCNACAEVDPTRAAILSTATGGGATTLLATRIRNAIALAVNPATGSLWAGGAGQDDLVTGHPYEYLDDVTAHAAPADYGWPDCEENRTVEVGGSNCASVVVPQVEFPAYQTIIGAVFYPLNQTGAYAFPAAYRGGIFAAMHGSWHASGGIPIAPPRVSFVAMNGDAPATPVNWSNPAVQWSDVLSGFQLADGSRWDRPTGIAVGPAGSLFVSSDQTGTIYRIRPGTRP